jgi:hypothetical protein
MCHRANQATESHCSCGYEFGQSPEKALELLRSQRRNAQIALLLLLLALGGGAILLYVMLLYQSPIIVIVAFAPLSLQILRTVHKLSITRDSIRQLEARTLPKAQLHKG